MPSGLRLKDDGTIEEVHVKLVDGVYTSGDFITNTGELPENDEGWYMKCEHGSISVRVEGDIALELRQWRCECPKGCYIGSLPPKEGP